MPRIFISYRRDDSAGYVGRIHDKLTARFGKNAVFTDIDAIPPGADFVQVVQEAVGSCDVLLAVIGKQWFIPGSDGNPRLHSPNDFVRLEIATALARDIVVIPVLVREASMPQPGQLPPDIQMLARRNAHVVSDRNFHRDVDALIKAMTSRKKRVAPRQRSGLGRLVRWLAMGTGFVFLVLCGLVVGSTVLLDALSGNDDPEERIEPIPGLWEVTRVYDDSPGCAEEEWESLEETYTAELDFELEVSEEFEAIEFTIFPLFEEEFSRGYIATGEPNDYTLSLRLFYSEITVQSAEFIESTTTVDNPSSECIYTTRYELIEAED